MTWYKAGTVTVTNGSTTATGAGTGFVGSVLPGDAFQGPDGRSYEIAAVVSATELTLARPYLGATAGGQTYSIQPTPSFMGDLATAAAALNTSYRAVRDGIGQGLFGDGTITTPGLRFAAQQDTGLYRDAANTMSFATAGVRAARASAIGMSFDTGRGIAWIGNGNEVLLPSDGVTGWVLQTGGAFTVRSLAGVTRLSVLTDGRLSAPTGHVMVRPGTAENQLITGFGFDPGVGIQMRTASGPAGNQGACAMWINCNSQNSRSINAAGTVNASGADYAEYMVKADGCASIAAGDVCGVDRDGKLTRTWADAVSFVVKSTAPAYVGGDTWTAGLPARPADLPAEPVAPSPPTQPEGVTGDEAEAQWADAMRAYHAAQAAYIEARTEWLRLRDRHASDLAAWEVLFEAERVKVDRIAFCGQVPVNMASPAAVGDYLVAAQDGDGITATAVAEADITFPQYRRRLGKVWAIRDGRPWIDVQHG